MAELQERYAYSGNNIVYIGKTRPGSSPESAKWQICRLYYTGTNPVQKRWANGDAKFDKVWDNRAAYSYVV